MNLNGRPTNPGELRTQISLQTRTISTDAGGAQKPVWATSATVWAKWENVHGNEATSQDAAVMSEQRATVWIRYRTGIDTTCAVLKGSVRYEILSIDNVRERDEYMELIVRVMRAA